jgi:signal transduction histidine kinase
VFEYLCVILAVSALTVAHLLRVRYLNRQLQESLEQRVEDRIQERTRIARELHDSLLQGFQGLMFRLEAVRRLLPDRAEEAAIQLDVTLERGRAAVNEGRRTVGELRAPGPIGNDLPQALADLGREFEPLSDPDVAPDYRVLVQGRAIGLAPIVRDETYRIAREAVRNAFRHARAKLIEVEAVFGERLFTVRVRDNGIGLDAAVLEQGHRKGHWGLPGMRERALGFGGELQVWSQHNAGTEIELKISGATAYTRHLRTWFARMSSRKCD